MVLYAYCRLLLLYEQHQRGEPLSKPILAQLCPNIATKIDTQETKDKGEVKPRERKV